MNEGCPSAQNRDESQNQPSPAEPSSYHCFPPLQSSAAITAPASPEGRAPLRARAIIPSPLYEGDTHGEVTGDKQNVPILDLAIKLDTTYLSRLTAQSRLSMCRCASAAALCEVAEVVHALGDSTGHCDHRMAALSRSFLGSEGGRETPVRGAFESGY